jgi:oxalate decarboxylase/phosphoglucose isomerase-like protein (cupin superfamily)
LSNNITVERDTEDFFVISGEIEGLRQDSEGYKWIGAKTGDYIHVPSNARHAWRNVSNKPTLVYIITTKNMGHFFQETGRLETNTSQPVTSEDLARFTEISTRYGYWNASSEENASVGIRMSF